MQTVMSRLFERRPAGGPARRAAAVGAVLAMLAAAAGSFTAATAQPGMEQSAAPGEAGVFGFMPTGASDVAAIRRAGGSVVKITADWSAIEPERGSLRWADLDAAIRAAASAGLRVTVVLAYTPRWASIGSGLELRDRAIFSRQPVRRMDDWEAFVRRAVTRYRSRVQEWQVWSVLSLPLWRGTAQDYVRYLTTTRRAARAADPRSRIVLATPYGVDLVWVHRMVREAGSSFDAVSLAPRGLEPEALVRPLRVLREQVLGGRTIPIWLEWDPRSAERGAWAGEILKVAAIARALQVARVDWLIEPGAAAPALQLFATHVGGKPAAGQLVSPPALALVFGKTNSAAVAWSVGGTGQLTLSSGRLTVISATGETTQTPEGQTVVALRPEPVILTGLDEAIASSARPVGDQPVWPPGARDLSGATEVTARLGRVNAEEGLYNMPFRTRRNGALEVVEVDGTEAVRTNAGRDVVYVYFDVDDSFMFFVNRRHGVEVTVEVRGASAPRQLGFNLFYDSMSDYRFTEWQWVEAKDGWATYTFRLPDAAFANSWGWDFAVNAAGNRREDLTVRSVTVRKVPSR